MSNLLLNVNGIQKKSSELTYNDLCILCDQFKNKIGRYIQVRDFALKNNLPGIVTTEKILVQNGLTFKEFLRKYGNFNRKTAEKEVINYQKYVDDYISKCKEVGHAITCKELKIYKLPRENWYIKHCPDENVKTWVEFVNWCGLIPTLKKTKEMISNILIEYDKELDRPIMGRDITVDNIGISIQMIKKYWKNLGECKKELGLKLTPHGRQYTFKDYKQKLDIVIDKLIANNKFRIRIIEDIILDKEFNGLGYPGLKNTFERENIDVKKYIQEKGLSFWKSEKGRNNYYVFDDGETISSSYEYDFSTFLKEIGFIYDRDYFRNITYKNIINNINLKEKIDCDYLFFNTFCVEIAGYLFNKNNDWREHNYKTQREKDYQKKMIEKEKLLLDNNIPYLFLFPEDFNEDKAYQSKILFFIMQNLYKYNFLRIID